MKAGNEGETMNAVKKGLEWPHHQSSVGRHWTASMGGFRGVVASHEP